MNGTGTAPAMEATAAIVAVEAPKRHRRSRRRGQRGSIFKRNNAYTIVYRTRDGKQKWEGGIRTKDAAQARLDEVLGAIRNNKYVEPSDQTFKEFCDEWMESAKPTLRPATWGSYQSALKKWILPSFGDYALCEIRKADVVKFLYKLLGDQSISQKFVKNVHVLLHRLFEAAIERDLVAANPAHKIKFPDASVVSAAKAEDRVVPMPIEVAQIFEKFGAVYQALLATGVITGLRRGELIGLYWGDIDWTGGKIHVRRAVLRVPKKLMDAGGFRNLERIGQTGLAISLVKSKKGYRLVEMPSNLAAILKALRQRQSGSSAPFVFQTEIGGPIDPDAVCKVLRAAQPTAGERRFTLHGLRHLYCSLLEKNGATLKFRQEKLGHDNASTTEGYTHLVDDRGREFSEKVGAEFQFPSVSLTLANPKAKGLLAPSNPL